MSNVRSLALLGADALPCIPDLKMHFGQLQQLQHLTLDLQRGMPPRYLSTPAVIPQLHSLQVHVCQVGCAGFGYTLGFTPTGFTHTHTERP